MPWTDPDSCFSRRICIFTVPQKIILMKKTGLLLLIVPLFIACNSNKTGFTINYEIEGPEGAWLKINRESDGNLVVVDSIQLTEGDEITLSGSVDEPELMYLTLQGERRPIRLFMENTGYTISNSWQDPVIETSGSAQKELNNYNAGLKVYHDRMSELYQQYRSAIQGGDQEKTDSLIPMLEETDSLINAYDPNYIEENPASYISVMALRNTFYRYDAEDLETMLNKLDESVRQSKEYVYMAGKLENMKRSAVGHSYVDFGLETPEGNVLKVSDVHNNNVLLLDFWASWCGPCRRANPELVAIYNEYHDRGFDILGVSLDRDRDSWLQAIEQDSLTWHHISDLQYWNSAGAELYGISSIPSSVLIDKDGVIRAKNLHGDELRAKIEELLED